MQQLQVIEARGIRVLTSKQIADEYGTTTDIIKKNFSNNRSRFVEGKHYIAFYADELKAFKNQVNNVRLVEKHTSHLYLWTEKGALLHAKSLNTDKAWEVYDYLVDFYFRAQEKQEPEKKRDVVPMAGKQMLVDVSGSAEIQVALDEAQDYLTAMRVALKEYNSVSQRSAIGST